MHYYKQLHSIYKNNVKKHEFIYEIVQKKYVGTIYINLKTK